MPEALERKLKAQVRNKPWSEERKNAYIYGTLRNTGWVPSTQKIAHTAKKLRGKIR